MASYLTVWSNRDRANTIIKMVKKYVWGKRSKDLLWKKQTGKKGKNWPESKKGTPGMPLPSSFCRVRSEANKHTILYDDSHYLHKCPELEEVKKSNSKPRKDIFEFEYQWYYDK